MKGKGLSRVLAIASTVTTLVLFGGIGASAASGHFGSATAGRDLLNLVAQPTAGHHAKCRGDNDEHHNATPGHKHGCDNEGHH